MRQRMRTGITAASGIELAAQLLDLRTARIKLLAGTKTGNSTTSRTKFSPATSSSSASSWVVRGAGAHACAANSRRNATIWTGSCIAERAKLLQEELASRLAENTGRNLHVLSLLTAVLLPMTLVTGVFGMNVAHLPGANSFPLVMLLIPASGGSTLAVLFWRRLL